MRFLEGRRDAAQRTGLLGLVRELEPEDFELALVGNRLGGQEPHRRRFTGAVRSEQADAGPQRDVEVQVVDSRDRAVALHDSAQANCELALHRSQATYLTYR